MRPHIGSVPRTLGRLLPLAAAATLLLALAPADGHAGAVIVVQSVSAKAGSSNITLDVTISNTGPSPIMIGGFAFGVSAGSGVTFTAVDTSTALPYIFAGHSLFGPDISIQPPNLPGTTLQAGDNYASPGMGISLGVGANNALGLGDVHLNVSSTSATGPIAITLASFPETNLSNQNGIDITAGTTFTSGTVTVVPQPTSAVPAAIAMAMGFVYWLRRRGRPT
jgi:hypothetical protein